MDMTAQPEIFELRRKRAVLDRAANRARADRFLWQHMAGDLAERLAAVSRDFSSALMIGPVGSFSEQILNERDLAVSFAGLSPAECRNSGGVDAGGDILPFEPESFDLIVCAGVHDSVNDLPGHLIQLRRTLRPDGLMLSVMFGAGSLPTLKSAMLIADGPTVSAHIHPQIELKSAADLLSRTGFAVPVADIDYLQVRYSSISRLINDLRDSGFSNALAWPRRYLGKRYLHDLTGAWTSFADDMGKVTEQFAFISMSGWAPSPTQPRPARRGSGSVSLADALKSNRGQDPDPISKTAPENR
jgi:NADH dehydrogenase [ubiquinone] 1 alpha subcomplex assembly factor 5